MVGWLQEVVDASLSHGVVPPHQSSFVGRWGRAGQILARIGAPPTMKDPSTVWSLLSGLANSRGGKWAPAEPLLPYHWMKSAQKNVGDAFYEAVGGTEVRFFCLECPRTHRLVDLIPLCAETLLATTGCSISPLNLPVLIDCGKEAG